jgi:nitric oxide reductase NorQ protein
VDRGTAADLVTLAGRLRNLSDRGLAEVPSTRLLVATGRLIASGLDPRKRARWRSSLR